MVSMITSIISQNLGAITALALVSVGMDTYLEYRKIDTNRLGVIKRLFGLHFQRNAFLMCGKR